MSPTNRAQAWLLVALMGLGSVVMWLVSPLFWLWFASHVVSSNSPSMGAYMLVLVGVVGTVMLVGKLLGIADRRWAAVTGADAGRKQERSWNKSMRGDRESGRRKSIIEPVMLTSVAAALLVFGAWFFLVAGSSLPGS